MANIRFVFGIIALTLALEALVLSFSAFACPQCFRKKDVARETSYGDVPLCDVLTTLWCESLQLSADHPFLVFMLSEEMMKAVIPNSPSEQEFVLQLHEVQELSFFLLPGSLLTVEMSSSHPGASFYLLRSNDILDRSLCPEEESNSHTNCFFSDDVTEDHLKGSTRTNGKEIVNRKTNSLKFHEIPASGRQGVGAKRTTFHLEARAAPEMYFIIIHHERSAPENSVSLSLFLNGTAYVVNNDASDGLTCRADSPTFSCDVTLDFLSVDRVFFKIPASSITKGKSSFKVKSACNLRFALLPALLVQIILVALLVEQLLLKVLEQKKLLVRQSVVSNSRLRKNRFPFSSV